MSGGYVIDEDGRPLQPERSWPTPTKDPRMDEDSPQGVQAFARYFVVVAERVWNTGDTTELEAISTPECTYCSNLVTAIQEEYLAGHWSDALQHQISKTESPVAFPDEESKYVVMVHLESGGGAYYDGTSVRSPETSREILELHVCRRAGHWLACEAIGSQDDS